MKTPKIDDGGAAARAEESRKQAELASQNIKKNFAQDLTQENIGQVIAGGTADAADAADVGVDSLLSKKKKQNLSTSLGINV